MDPLSLAANIIAVIGAASATAEGLKRIVRLRQAPEEALQFMNEVHFSSILSMIVSDIYCSADIRISSQHCHSTRDRNAA